MSSPPPSLQEQQQSFMRAQLMMAMRLPPPPPSAAGMTSPSSHLPPKASTRQATPAIAPSRDLSSRADGTAKTKRSRQRKTNCKTTTDGAFVQPWQSNSTPPIRKPAHVVQKEHRQALIDEVRELEAHVERLRLHVGLPTQADRDEVALGRAVSVELDEKIHANRRYAIQLKSQVMAELHMPPVNTLATYIHLPRDMDQRRSILQGMKDVKIRRAAEFGLAQFEHLDARTSFMSQEQFTTEDAVFHCHRLELIVFRNFQTARPMYDALFFFIYNMEVSVTEMVNQVAVREDDEDIEPTIWNHRIVTTTEDIGCIEELNIVGFAHFFESYAPLGGAPLGVIIIESVDEDDLYPYVPHERVRKSFTSLYLFREVVDPNTQRKIVVLETYLNCSQLPPEFPLDPALLAKLHEYTPRWAKLMKQYLFDYTVPPSTAQDGRENLL